MVVLLLGALAVAGVLAYQAQDAARSHRASAERALREYAALAAWEFARHADMSLTALQMTSFVLPISEVEGTAEPGPLPSAAAFRTAALRDAGWCDCLDSSATFFRMDLRDGEFDTAGPSPLTVRPWLTEGVGERLRTVEGPTAERTEIGRAPLRSNRPTPYLFKSRAASVSFGTIQGRPRVVLHYLVHDANDRPLAVYGYEADPGAFTAPVLRAILEDTPLLPGSLTGELPNDSVLAITVRDRDGNVVFRSAALDTSSYEAVDTLAEPFDDLVVHAALRPQIAGDLLIGGLPSSRLPLLLALLGLTAGLIVVALIQLRRHQELARLRRDFVAGISHELRTPLAQIRLYAELLRSGRLGAEDRARSVRVIDQEARRLSHLVANVLQFSRAERGAAPVRPEPRALAPLVRQTLDDFAPLARAQRAEIHGELDDGVVAAVDADALRQVLLNLLDNAVKYGPAGQRITVGLAARDGTARLHVDDQGPGIPEDRREDIWEPYRRLDAAIASGTGGSGIGLAVVRELVERHGGRAVVEHAPGGGARFVIELPLAPAGPAEDAPQPHRETA